MACCAACRHWEERLPFNLEHVLVDTYQWDSETQAEYIARLEERHLWSTCTRMKGPQWEERQEGTLAVAEDGSAYAAHVLTREDFGCVMYAQKDGD